MLSNPLKRLLPVEWALATLFLAASIYFHANPGGSGFRIPANIVVWLIANLIGFYSLYRLTKKPYFYLPRYYLYILAFPALAFISGIFAGVEIPNQWLMRMLYIWGGALFLFALFQYPLKQARIDRVLFIVVIAGLLHAAVGIAQIFFLTDMPGWLPVNSSGIPTGLFQQINNQASFQVTVLLIAFWLITRPAVRYGHCSRFIVLAIAIACSAFVISYSGSRVGALGFILAAPLFLVSRWRFIRQDYWLWLTVLCIMLLAAISANSFENQRGLASVAEKTAAINAGYSSTARLGIYSITLELIKEEPVFGHGIGSFVRVWQHKKPVFYAEYPDATLPKERVSHPHNETIFWLVEGGILAGLGLLLVFIGVLKNLKSLPHSRRYAYAALLIPIALHTQVELPFYISAVHWFLFLLLLFVVMQPGRQRFRVGLSLAASKLVKYIAIITYRTFYCFYRP
ncbi:O-antigen ligase family protein [Methylophaga sp. OBS4]|uniref:O-antigen ligase family protein n=1 Tax=Methylophaga sp. OBS4 TaxID=2991935 RepID=UPI00224DBEC5|nr:Wzy polymerase domain-containing protein [Methylophaga sp. OBS4]MCX4187789.1 O-antigen ligase family protein [Methylophaga sp. OBS4]